jgi:hypothetical protein
MTIRAQGEITGKWRGQTRNGTEIVLHLVAKGTALTGALARNGESVPISDGKVSKQTLTFKAVLNDQTEGFSGELNGDQNKIWMDRLGPPSTAVLQRVKSK